jgi:hypothetical protein
MFADLYLLGEPFTGISASNVITLLMSSKNP